MSDSEHIHLRTAARRHLERPTTDAASRQIIAQLLAALERALPGGTQLRSVGGGFRDTIVTKGGATPEGEDDGDP